MTLLPKWAQDAKRVREAATRLLPPKPLEDDGTCFYCPVCEGEGTVDDHQIVEFDTELAAYVHCYGIGDSYTNLEKFIQQSPQTQERLERALELAIDTLTDACVCVAGTCFLCRTVAQIHSIGEEEK